ncbi:NAD-dependent epimerase/dehydratase family protein [bacterium]|nr:NAD-dependent epimerase/dehydratase family protein [bacterium]
MISSAVITGGAGFIGSTIALWLRQQYPGWRVLAFDNLRRRGSEWNLPRLKDAGIEFVHGDIRQPEELRRLGATDLIIDCAAEPSVYASEGGSPREVLDINLIGTINTLEWARTCGAKLLFLSTSRVYPIAGLNALPYETTATRFQWTNAALQPGVTPAGLTSDFPLAGARSFYGAAKLASEMLIQEYVLSYGLRAMINRCGIVAGPWQFGKVDQGVITLWMSRHLFADSLKYIGFGGTGLQVRDVLHVADLCDLIARQLALHDDWDGSVYNVGGGLGNSVSLAELTTLCQARTGRQLTIVAQPETHPLDVRIYITDNQRVSQQFDWRPLRSIEETLAEIQQWLLDHASRFQSLMG